MNISALRRKARPFLPAPGMRRQCWPRTRAREGQEVSHQPRGICINELMNRMRPSPCYKRGDLLEEVKNTFYAYALTAASWAVSGNTV